jgi:hypothetical protein
VFEVTRLVRWLNLAFGVWLIVAPWVLGHGQPETVNSTLVGLALTGLAWVRGVADESFGGGWRALWDSRAAASTGATG